MKRTILAKQLALCVIVALTLSGCANHLLAQDKETRVQVFKKLDGNHDGQVTRDELPIRKAFVALDLDGDQVITETEAVKAVAAMTRKGRKRLVTAIARRIEGRASSDRQTTKAGTHAMPKASSLKDADYPALEVQRDGLKGNHLDVSATLHLIDHFLIPAWGDLPRFQPPNPAIGSQQMPLTKPGDLPLNNKSAVYSLLDRRPRAFKDVVDPLYEQRQKRPAILIFHGSGGGASTLLSEALTQCPEAKVFALEGPFHHGKNGSRITNHSWTEDPIEGVNPATGVDDGYSAKEWARVRPDNHNGTYDRSLSVIRKLIERIDEFGCDPERVYLMGYSMGGRIFWYTLRENADLLAGGIVMGSPMVPELETCPYWTKTAPYPEKLKAIPVLEILGTQDRTWPPPWVEGSPRIATELWGMQNYARVMVGGAGHTHTYMPRLRRAFFKALVSEEDPGTLFGKLNIPKPTPR